MDGWIKLHRCITDNSLWKEKPFTKGQAWIDLLILANHKDNKVLKGNKWVEYKRGTVHTSMVYLADRWGWDRRKVQRFLKTLEMASMVAYELSADGTGHGTVITIENYAFYQGDGTDDGTPFGTPHGTPHGTHNKNVIRNIKNVEEYNVHFESLWSAYPNKRGKAAIKDSKKKELFKEGDKVFQAIDNYKAEIKKNNIEAKYILYGSTFFNGRWKDYIGGESNDKVSGVTYL